MKLLVIVLCLLSERFLVHLAAYHRFAWFESYVRAIEQKVGLVSFLSRPWIRLALTILPLCLGFLVVYWFVGPLFFGMVGFLLNLLVFYVCLGPDNPFYPASHLPENERAGRDVVGEYLVQTNGQLFAVIFWYIILGPLSILIYRLISLYASQSTQNGEASRLMNVLDWLPVRMTALLYLLVGHFQAGVRCFSHAFFSSPSANHAFLKECGLTALNSTEDEAVALPLAETLVEHATIVLLVLLACFTFVAWM